jgi:hypothetical protein
MSGQNPSWVTNFVILDMPAGLDPGIVALQEITLAGGRWEHHDQRRRLPHQALGHA